MMTTALAPGSLVHARYRVTRLIGRGGMGAVYEAVDTRLGSTVALKQTLARGDRLDEAFAREARLLASLRHSALPVVSDYFAEGEAYFLVMQFIPGSDLAALMAGRAAPFSIAEVLPWAEQILDALAYLHGQDPPIVHRDIKPQNLKLTPDGQVILLDFGLAKGAAGADAGQAREASLLAYTPNYAPLEQIQGSGTDPRSDLYSLAATLYTLLTGASPPTALDRAAAALRGDPDPLRPLAELNPQVPRAVADLLDRCLSLSAADRPPSAAAVRAELAARASRAGASSAGMPTIALGAPGPAQAPPPAPSPSMQPRPGRSPWLPLFLIGAAAAVLVASLAGLLFFLADSLATGPSPAATAPPVAAAPTPDPREQDPPAAPAVQMPDIAATVAAVQSTSSTTVAEAQATAQAIFGDVGPSIGTPLLEFGQEGDGDGFLKDPRGVAVGPDGAIYVADYSTRRIQRFSPEGRFERSFFVEDERPILALAADRRGRVMVAQNFQVSVFDGATGELLTTFTDAEGRGFEDLEILDDGSMIAIPWAGDDLVRLSADGVETGRIPGVLAAADTTIQPLAVAADRGGDLYILGDYGRTVYIFGPDGNYKSKFSVPNGTRFGALAVDSRGRVYVTGIFQGVHVFEDGQPVGTIELPSVAFALSFDERGDLYAATNGPRIVKVRP